MTSTVPALHSCQAWPERLTAQAAVSCLPFLTSAGLREGTQVSEWLEVAPSQVLPLPPPPPSVLPTPALGPAPGSRCPARRPSSRLSRRQAAWLSLCFCCLASERSAAASLSGAAANSSDGFVCVCLIRQQSCDAVPGPGSIFRKHQPRS